MIPNKMDRRLKGAERVLGGEDVLDAISGTVDGKSVGSKTKSSVECLYSRLHVLYSINMV
jgi:hypothetical protein